MCIFFYTHYFIIAWLKWRVSSVYCNDIHISTLAMNWREWNIWLWFVRIHKISFVTPTIPHTKFTSLREDFVICLQYTAHELIAIENWLKLHFKVLTKGCNLKCKLFRSIVRAICLLKLFTDSHVYLGSKEYTTHQAFIDA